MGGIFPSDTTIYIGSADQVAAALCHTSNAVVGEIEKFGLTGGNQDIESVPVIGGYVDKEKPREQFEVSFDVIVSNTASSTFNRWDEFKFGTALTSAGEGANKAVAIVMSTSGAAPYKVYAFNNVKAVTWEPEMNADDMLRGSITFKFSPTTSLGVANLKTSTVATATVFPVNWS